MEGARPEDAKLAVEDRLTATIQRCKGGRTFLLLFAIYEGDDSFKVIPMNAITEALWELPYREN